MVTRFDPVSVRSSLNYANNVVSYEILLLISINLSVNKPEISYRKAIQLNQCVTEITAIFLCDHELKFRRS